MNVNKKSFLLLGLMATIATVSGVAWYFLFYPQTPEVREPVVTVPVISASVSKDGKSIMLGDKAVLAVDDEAIVKFFTTESELCNESNIDSNSDRKLFCKNKVTFKQMTKFTSVASSPDMQKIGFTIGSDALSPDTVSGIFYPQHSTNKVYFLTNYYLGNEFISFSPGGIHFVYRNNCFEAECGFVVRSSGTRKQIVAFGDTPDHANYEFLRWVSDREIEYKEREEVKRFSF